MPRFKVDPETLRKDLQRLVGEPVFFLSHVETMLKHFGKGYVSQNTLRSALIGGRIFAEDIGFDLGEYGLESRTKVYRASTIWDYLTKLDESGDINLGASVGDMQALIDGNYHLEERGEFNNPSNVRRISPEAYNRISKR